jgi:glycosyltransferase involved in cell wall biosynthesis
MPPITALLHTANDERRLARALETLLPCRETLVVDHDSTDSTKQIAKRYGARFVCADRRPAFEYAQLAVHDWVLCLDPSESLTESLQATLFEWNLLDAVEVPARAFSLFARQQIGEVWKRQPEPETRLVHRNWRSWKGHFPEFDATCPVLEGELLRLQWP